METLNDWLTWMESSHPKSIDMGLSRVRVVAERLKLTHFDCPVITIAGTNGKGSTVALLQTLFCHNGMVPGAYTSPHLLRFNERIQIAGKEASDEEIIQALVAVKDACLEISLTYFELTTLAALWLFKRYRVDVVILEVGLGGRLDATNVVDADIAVITSIDLDHTEYLGTTRDAIAKEKAGILRPGIPCICGDAHPPSSLIRHAKELTCPLYIFNRDFGFKEEEGAVNWWGPNHTQRANLPQFKLVETNVAAFLMVVQLLSTTFPFSEAKVKATLSQTRLAGRFQKILKRPEVIVDVAHNVASALQLSKALSREPVNGRTYGLIGIMADKDIKGTLAALAADIDEWVAVPLPVSRGAKPEAISSLLCNDGLKCSIKQDVKCGIAFALSRMGGGDRLVIFGSFVTADLALKYFNNHADIDSSESNQ